MSLPEPAIASFLPATVTRPLSQHPERSVPFCEKFEAASLFVDITGFTRLTERYAAQSDLGIERLTNILASYFGDLVSLVRRFNGDVNVFAGDAILVLWPVGTESLRDVTHRAIECSLAIQEQLGCYDADDGTQLKIKQIVGAGNALSAHLGRTTGARYNIVGGSVIDDLVEASTHTRTGEIILGEGAAALMDLSLVVAKRHDDHLFVSALKSGPLSISRAQPEKVQYDISILERYVPALVQRRLSSSEPGWFAEFRTSTPLFVRIDDLGFEGPDAVDQLQTVVLAVHDQMQRYEGTILRTAVDDKGTIIYCAFGTPAATHEDDPSRAIAASLGLFRELRRLGHGCAIGIGTGRVFCGVIGNDERREYALHGDVVNLASRLMSSSFSSGGVFCDRATRAAVRSDDYRFAQLPSFVLKGKSEPVPVFQVSAQSDHRGLSWELVDRTAEMAIFRRRIEALRRGSSSIVVVEAEPGIGKSSLIARLASERTDETVRHLHGEADAVEKTTPYFAWRQVFSQIYRVPGRAVSSLEQQRILEEMAQDDALARMSPLLNSVLPTDIPDNSFTSSLIGESRISCVRECLTRVLQAEAASAPLVISLDDAHWMDSASWALVESVSKSVHPLLLVVALRTSELITDPHYRRLLEDERTRRISLSPLSAEDTSVLVRRCLGSAAVSDSVLAEIFGRSSGHPFFSVEIASSLRDSQKIVVRDGICDFYSSDVANVQDVLPDSVQATVQARVDTLSADEVVCLKLASVVGRTFSLAPLLHIHPDGSTEDELRLILGALKGANLVESLDGDPGSYAFRHVVIRDVLYDSLAFAQRKEAHRKLAEWYEQSGPRVGASMSPLIAYHREKAGDIVRAVSWYEMAARHALGNGAHRETIEFLVKADTLESSGEGHAKLSRDPLRRASAERVRGEAHYSLGEHQESIEHFEQGLRFTGRPVPRTDWGLATAFAAQATLQVLRSLIRMTGLRRTPAYDEDPKTRTLMLAARINERLAELYYFSGDLLRASTASVTSLNLAEQLSPSPELARALATNGIAVGLTPFDSLAAHYISRAQAVAASLRQPLIQAEVDLLSSAHAIGQGKAKSILDRMHGASDTFEKLRDFRHLGQATAMLAWAELVVGDHNAALALTKRTHEVSLQAETRQNRAMGFVIEAFALERAGRFEEAKNVLEQLVAEFDDMLESDPVMRASIWATMALVALKQGNLSLAEEWAGLALKGREGSPPLAYWEIIEHAYVAEVYMCLWELASERSADTLDIRRKGRRAIRRVRRFARMMRYGYPIARWLEGRAARVEGRTTRANALLENGLQWAERFHMPYEQGLLCFELGKHAHSGNFAALSYLTRARDLFERLGADYYVQRVRETIEVRGT